MKCPLGQDAHFQNYGTSLLFIQPFLRVCVCVCVHAAQNQVLQLFVHPTSYDVSGTQSQEEDRKDVISVRASLPVSPSPSLMSL